MEKKIKYFSEKAETVKEEKRVLRFIGSNEKIDRDGEVVKAEGWKLNNYKKNPVVLVNHQHHELPVAKAKKVWIDKDKKSLMFDIQFPEADISPQGDTLYKLYRGGYMNATSVGFMPNFEKIEWGKKKGDPSAIFNEQELLEISLVSVPANPTALMTQKSMKSAIENKVIDEVELKDLEMWLAEFFAIELEKDEIIEDKNKESAELVIEEKVEEDNINKNVEVKHICAECGEELEVLCKSCKEKLQEEMFYKNMYLALVNGE